MTSCTDDQFCKNIDHNNSTPGNLVYKCPTSTCSNGSCNCVGPCVKDTRTGICLMPYETLSPSESGVLPMPTPPLGVCVKTPVSADQFVCWKIVKIQNNQLSSAQETVEECALSECDPTISVVDNITKSYKTKKVAGKNMRVYNNKSFNDESLLTKLVSVSWMISMSLFGILFLYLIYRLIVVFIDVYIYK